MPYHLWMGNIVNIATDAIVNAANTELKRTPGICEAIFAAADSAKLEEACRRHGHCPIGHSVMTPSFGLPARYIIHVAGPGWFGGAERERLLLADCYRRAMTRAVTSGCKSIAFPLIFSGNITSHEKKQSILPAKRLRTLYAGVLPWMWFWSFTSRESI